MRGKLCILLMTYLLPIAGWASPANLVDAEWNEIETPHFRIVTNGRPESVKSLAEDLERFRVVASQLLSAGEDQHRLTIFALADRNSYAAFVGDGNAKRTGGVFHNTSYGSFALVNLGSDRSLREHPAREFLFHEYTHFLTYGRSPLHYPYWYSEGFAEVFSTVDFPEDGNYVFGAIPMDRAASLYYDQPMPLEELLRATPATADESQNARVYAGGWMLTHWLIMSSGKADRIEDYVSAYNRGEDPVDALVSALEMPLDELERHYTEQAKGKFSKRTGLMPRGYKPAQPIVQPLSREDAVAEIARYLVMSGKNADSLRELVQYARAVRADSHELTSIMAVAKTRAGEFSRAESMLASIPQSLRGEQWYQSAEASLWLEEQLVKGVHSDPERLETVRDRFAALIEADNEVPAYWRGLAVAMQKLGYPRGEYLKILEQAYLRAPREVGIAWWYANELYLDRDAEIFARVAHPLLMQITEEKPRTQLQAMLADLLPDIAAPEVDAVEKNTIIGAFTRYKGYSTHKALALALDYKGAYTFGFAYDSPDQNIANGKALEVCEARRMASNVESLCRIYAEGDKIIDAGGSLSGL
ncbi:hypothetical protein [Microbulbifer sp.]|uniref:hypothetical protein n=1 Tax=Microbulbifer sp. TaxID=1908541 RepID=UPI003F33FC7D